MHTHFISCDWGTSSFRLRLVNIPIDSLEYEISTLQGIAATYKAYTQNLNGEAGSPVERLNFYLGYLSSQIQLLANHTLVDINEIPVVVSGMASSTIGMWEMPYAKLPFSLTGVNAHTIWLPLTDSSASVLIISGLQSNQDVIRGEETQMVGLATKVLMEEAICIFPGTHSKHIYCSKGQIDDFRTYMTGELFTAIATHTILQASIEKPEATSDHLFEYAFSEGVQASTGMENLLHALFTVRTGELFKQRNKQENYHYLSGLLIGKELQDLQKYQDANLLLCSSSHLLPFYQRAITVLELSARTSIISAPVIDTIAMYGQLKILRQVTGQ